MARPTDKSSALTKRRHLLRGVVSHTPVGVPGRRRSGNRRSCIKESPALQTASAGKAGGKATSTTLGHTEDTPRFYCIVSTPIGIYIHRL